LTQTKTKKASKPADQTMSQIEYAAHRKVSRQYIGRLAKAGALVMRGLRIDVAASDAVFDDKDIPIAIGPDGEPTNLTEARFLRELYGARLRRLEFEEKAGKLIPAEAVTRAWTSAAGVIKNRMLAIPSRTAGQLAALTDPKAVREALGEAIEKVLKSLSEELRYARN
jgi:phage terminase Nu1 subunit (DNA packaging protein)